MKSYSLFFGLALALALTSCDKTDDPINSTPGETFPSLQSYFTTKAPSAEAFELTAELGGTFTAKNGSKITIPANVLLDANGQPVTGKVEIRFKEIFSTSDIIFSGIYPISGAYALNSGGEFFISAKQNGNTLHIADGNMIQVTIPAQAVDPNMMLFWAEGEEDADSVNWEVQNDSNGAGGGFNGGGKFTFSGADSTYLIDMDSMRWGNIDAFMIVNYFNCTFNLTGVSGLDQSNTSAFAVFKDQNTVWPVGTESWGGITNNVIEESHLADVPLNLLVISVVDNVLYYGLLDVTPAAGQTYTISMQTTTSANLDAIIKGLP